VEAAEQADADSQARPALIPLPVGVTIRLERSDDVDAVNSMVVEAFDRPVVGDLLRSLRSTDAWLEGMSFVADAGGRIVGHVLFTRSLLDAPRRLLDVLVLSPLAVAPSFQRQGIGSALVRHGVQETQRRAEPLVFLEGSPEFYPRLGFTAGGQLGFRRPSLRIPEVAFMVHRNSSYEPWMTGTLVYAQAFWRHDCVGVRD
jgi:putative acetyltransferase